MKSNSNLFGVFIDIYDNLVYEPYDSFESIEYIYSNTEEKCKKFVEKYKDVFHNYTEFFEFLHKWCYENDIDFVGCVIDFNEKAV